jgi:hypothetical protein
MAQVPLVEMDGPLGGFQVEGKAVCVLLWVIAGDGVDE